MGSGLATSLNSLLKRKCSSLSLHGELGKRFSLVGVTCSIMTLRMTRANAISGPSHGGGD